MTDRSDILEKIRNLRAKAANEASSEAEAEAAARAAAKLLMKHEVTEEELNENKSLFTHQGFDDGRRRLHPTLFTASFGIAALTGTKCWNDRGTLVFAGVDSDVEMAMYLSEMILGAAKRAYQRYPHRSRANHDSFMLGFGRNLKDRLVEMSQQRTAATTGTDLVVMKTVLVNTYVSDELGIKTRPPRKRTVRSNAYHAGQQAGSKLNINRPIKSAGGSHDRNSQGALPR